MTIHFINVLLPLLFLVYQIIIDFADLFPFNDIHSRDKRLRKFEVLGNYPPLVIIALCFYIDTKVGMIIGFVLTSIILLMHLFAWWIPYLTGYPSSIKKDYEKYFKRTLKILPKVKDHIIPDVEHIGVGVLLVLTFIFELKDVFSIF